MKTKMIPSLFFKTVLLLFLAGSVYLLLLFYPQPFFRYRESAGNITVYSDQPIPAGYVPGYIRKVEDNISKSVIRYPGLKQNFFIANNPFLFNFFANKNSRASGLNYVAFNHSVFLRKADIPANRLYGASGKAATGDRTLDYFMAHEMTHTLEFLSMPWWKYPLNTNWTLEGYSEYIAHGSPSYEVSLDRYLHMPENSGAKYYTRVRTMVAYPWKRRIFISQTFGVWLPNTTRS